MLLSTYSAELNVAVALGVGLAAVVGTLMLLRGWTLRRVLGCSLLPAVLLSAATLCDPQLQQVVPFICFSVSRDIWRDDCESNEGSE